MEAVVLTNLKAEAILMEELLFKEAPVDIRIHQKVLFSKNKKIILKMVLNSTLDPPIQLKTFNSIIIQQKDQLKLTQLKIKRYMLQLNRFQPC